MAQHTAFRNPQTGAIQRVKIGFSWTLFFFSSFLGLPLFLRRLNVWGGVILALYLFNILVTVVANADLAAAAQLFLALLFLAFSVFFGLKGNELTAKNYLEHGWEWAEPENEDALFAKAKWALV